MKKENELVTPGEVLGKASECKAGKGAYTSPHNSTVYASLSGLVSIIPAANDSPDQVQTTFFPNPSNFASLFFFLARFALALYGLSNFLPFACSTAFCTNLVLPRSSLELLVQFLIQNMGFYFILFFFCITANKCRTILLVGILVSIIRI